MVHHEEYNITPAKRRGKQNGRDRPYPLESDKYLTASETRVAVGYTEGLIGKEIAGQYGLSYNTVVKHTQNIYEKAGIKHSTNALVAWFLSLNYRLDLSDLKRSIEGAVLLAIFLVGLAMNNDSIVVARRIQTRRVETRSGRSRKGRRDDTFYV